MPNIRYTGCRPFRRCPVTIPVASAIIVPAVVPTAARAAATTRTAVRPPFVVNTHTPPPSVLSLANAAALPLDAGATVVLGTTLTSRGSDIAPGLFSGEYTIATAAVYRVAFTADIAKTAGPYPANIGFSLTVNGLPAPGAATLVGVADGNAVSAAFNAVIYIPVNASLAVVNTAADTVYTNSSFNVLKIG